MVMAKNCKECMLIKGIVEATEFDEELCEWCKELEEDYDEDEEVEWIF